MNSSWKPDCSLAFYIRSLMKLQMILSGLKETSDSHNISNWILPDPLCPGKKASWLLMWIYRSFNYLLNSSFQSQYFFHYANPELDSFWITMIYQKWPLLRKYEGMLITMSSFSDEKRISYSQVAHLKIEHFLNIKTQKHLLRLYVSKTTTWPHTLFLHRHVQTHVHNIDW